MPTNAPREWDQYVYYDPQVILTRMRGIELSYPIEKLDNKVASLRTHGLRKFGEGRQAALFCYSQSQILKTSVWYALVEKQDYDFIARFVCGVEICYAPVQLKEWCPERLPGVKLPIQEELNKLVKYNASADLVVAFYMNRNADVNLDELCFSKLKFKELWFFGATNHTQNEWLVSGNLLSANCTHHRFTYPET